MFNFNKIISGFDLNNIFGGNRCRPYGTYKVINQEELMTFLTNDIYIIDVRTDKEFSSMHIKNSINIPLNMLQRDISVIVADKDAKILVYCSTGDRTCIAIQKLNNMGYNNIYIWGNGGLNTLKIKELIE
ncbi:MAG: rhodanese-like domain-containing protein [Clostridia bacterium]